nr:right-handed parallel beta-helix repeat-containing protein [Vibrio qinghaiensis]
MLHYIFISLILLSLSPAIIAEVVSHNVIEYGAIANDGQDDSSAFQNALNQLNNGDTLIIPSGEYQICKTLYLKKKNNIEIIGSIHSKLKKCSPFNGEYLLSIMYTQNIKLQGLSFEGLNNGDLKPIWGEQGVYLGSTKGTLVVQNKFARFGDAALRMTTASNDLSIQPGSMAIRVSHNRFEHCTQVTTTQATVGTEMPGTQDIIIDNNQFNACKLKLSARADTRGAKIISNHFENINGTSNEVSYYSDVYYSGNTFSNINGFAINIYPNSRTEQNVQWGNISIIGNTFDAIQQGIRLQSFSINDPTNQSIKNIQISNNIFERIYFDSEIENKYKAIIRTNSQDNLVSFENVNITGNQYQLTPYSKFISLDNKSKFINIKNNEQLYNENYHMQDVTKD